ncbi:MAG: acyl-CoA desaturase [Betaproteobacteria bacterium]|jgi:stearoyl-CoA desaturase (delta-9 desaturase)|nr:acyl-CoA desaturase [Betaproteobacteria bacterium]NBR97792.1 acyl-CoA desaturase [Betaproteobacteria bacterium]NBS93072.1 acyl-CoA desaturase [Betaproteobacteria bacterium]NBT05801.1 acyl-CoA desaturase [Betaproteobacteria bacterium]NBY53258.1 acyl-CoA desaturase [Betaproteobacteria bacterium]
MLHGLIELPWWGYVVVALTLTHITIASVTIYLHRHSAHRALDLHPIPAHFFRFWLWLTTSMGTQQWTAVHRKHHARCETEDDPHSPQMLGISKVLWEGAELYAAAKQDAAMIETFGRGCPDDWIERNLYMPHQNLGILLMLGIDVLLFGPIGFTVWAVQMIWIPLFAAGVINGIGHFWGYRNFQSDDASTNIVPWGILVGGEELHNNHHAFASSARLSNRWYEFDIGWFYIRVLEIMGLASVKKVAPRLKTGEFKLNCDQATLQAVITHRSTVLQEFARDIKATCAAELARLSASQASLNIRWNTVRRWLKLDKAALPAAEQARVSSALESSAVLATVQCMREELGQLWARSNATSEQLVQQLNDWCHRAEASGIEALAQFSRRLRCYA